LQTYKTKEWTSWKKINKKFKQNHFCLVFSLWGWLMWGTKILKEFCCFFSTSKAFIQFKGHKNSLILISSTLLLQSDLPPHSPLWFLNGDSRRIFRRKCIKYSTSMYQTC
jgi:hypothetical protein